LPNHGIFAYPVLMAADILIYDSNVVPWARDQKHIWKWRATLLSNFNEGLRQTFVSGTQTAMKSPCAGHGWRKG